MLASFVGWDAPPIPGGFNIVEELGYEGGHRVAQQSDGVPGLGPQCAVVVSAEQKRCRPTLVWTKWKCCKVDADRRVSLHVRTFQTTVSSQA